jgi:hypothetical protein
MLANNNFAQHNNNQHEKVGGQNLRANRFNSLPENPQFVQQNQQKNQNFPFSGTNQNYPSPN